MITYEIKLEKIGEITMLPDSQRLFGFLISLVKNIYNSNDNDINQFITKLLSGGQSCMVSNLLPSGYYPMPKGYIIDSLKEYNVKDKNKTDELEKKEIAIKKELDNKSKKINNIKESNEKKRAKLKEDLEELDKKITNLIKGYKELEKLSSKMIYETVKKIDYIKREDLKDLLKDIKGKRSRITAEDLEKYDFISEKKEFIQKFRLESQFKKLPGFPNVSYSLAISSLKDKNNKEVNEFSFFVSTEDDSILSKTLEKLKKEIQDNGGINCILGEKGSLDYNEYNIIDIGELSKELVTSKSKKYLNLGMLLPSESVKLEESIIDIFISDRKPFEIEYEVSKVISFISAGSVLKSEIVSVGKCIKNKYNPLYENAIIFGNSFVEEWED